MVQWLRLHASSGEGVGLIPGQGTTISLAVQRGQKQKKIKTIAITKRDIEETCLGMCGTYFLS